MIIHNTFLVTGGTGFLGLLNYLSLFVLIISDNTKTFIRFLLLHSVAGMLSMSTQNKRDANILVRVEPKTTHSQPHRLVEY
jgi:hypothetical protein